MLDNSFKLLISDDAELDILDAFLWYEDQKSELGNSFLKDVELSLIAIQKQPQYYHIVKLNTRAYVMKRFPFSIIYHLVENTINVLAVFHTSRNPIDWQNRNIDL